MGLFSFFKKTDKTGTDATVDSSELIEGGSQAASEADVETALSIHPDWNISKEQEYVLRFLSNDLPPLKGDQLSLSGISIEVDERNGNWNVEAFFRSSLEKAIRLGQAELLIQDSENNVLAAQQFDLAELGTIPAFADRPWVFTFKKASLKTADVPQDGWKLAFNVQSLMPHRLDLDPAWEEALQDSQKAALEEVVGRLPKLKPREVNITGFQTRFADDGSLAVSVLIRNGHTKHIQLEQLPLEVLDASGSPVASGAFKLDKLEIKANTSKPWTFVFPKNMLRTEQPDFSRWTARVPRKA